MEYAEWLEMEREILARDGAAFVGERPLAGWEIDGRKHVGDVDVYAVWTEEQERRIKAIADLFLNPEPVTWDEMVAVFKGTEENAHETH